MAFQVRKSPFEFRGQGTHVQSELNQSRLKGKVQVELIESLEEAQERPGQKSQQPNVKTGNHQEMVEADLAEILNRVGIKRRAVPKKHGLQHRAVAAPG